MRSTTGRAVLLCSYNLRQTENLYRHIVIVQIQVFHKFLFSLSKQWLLFTAESRTCCAITGHNLWLEMGFAHRRRRFLMAKPVTITAQKAVNSNKQCKCSDLLDILLTKEPQACSGKLHLSGLRIAHSQYHICVFGVLSAKKSVHILDIYLRL